MLTLTLVASLLLAQTTQSQIVDGTVATRKATVTANNALKVEGTVTGSVSTATSTVSFSSTPGTCVSVGTSSTTLVAANSSRKAIFFVSKADNTARVHFKFGATATTSNMPLEIGQSFGNDTGTIYTGQIDAISASGTQTVCVVEL